MCYQNCERENRAGECCGIPHGFTCPILLSEKWQESHCDNVDCLHHDYAGPDGTNCANHKKWQTAVCIEYFER